MTRNQRRQHVGGQRVPNPVSRCSGGGASGPVRRRESGQSVGAVHRRHPEPDPGVQKLAGGSAETTRDPEGSGCSLRNRVRMSGTILEVLFNNS